MAIFKNFKKAFKYYTSDLSYKDVEKLIKRDVPEVYDFYARRIKRKHQSKNKFIDFFYFIGNLFIAFLNQLTPIRRVIYTVSLLFFLWAMLQADWQLAFFAFIVLNILIAFELADKLTAKNELEIARDIQTSLMPKKAPESNYYDFACHSETAKEVGGDYLDFFTVPDDNENSYIIVGDISGKGMAAAIHMVQVQTILKQLIKDSKTPAEILTSLNNHIKQVFENGNFFTAGLAQLNSTGKIKFSRAGHLPLIHYRFKKQEFNIVRPDGIGLGLADNQTFKHTLKEVEIKTEAGDIIVLYTDGIVEAMNRFKYEYGEQRLKRSIELNCTKDAKIICDEIINDLKDFTEFATVNDDITLLVMKRK